jgi:hypothetical protein
MMRVRSVLYGIAIVWLSCQAITMALVPAVLLTSAADADADECTCTHGADAMCPMHHHQTTDSTHCVMQTSTTIDGAMLTSLLGVAGLIPPHTSRLVATRLVSSTDFTSSPEISRFAPPDPPPPRT